jgi:two-component system nitrate/nitrite response regulator NarL
LSGGTVIRIVIVGEIRLYREGLADLLGRIPGLEVVGTMADRDKGYEAIARVRPDIVLLDMATAGSHEAIGRIRELAAETQVVALGVADVEKDLLNCAEAGVAGYVPREGTLDSLVDAIRSAVLGELRCSPQMAGTMLRRLAALAAIRSGVVDRNSLTSREKEILRLIDDGCSNKEIARRLGIEVATVKNHVHNLLDKLHVHRRGEAAAQVRSRSGNVQSRRQ